MMYMQYIASKDEVLIRSQNLMHPYNTSSTFVNHILNPDV